MKFLNSVTVVSPGSATANTVIGTQGQFNSLVLEQSSFNYTITWANPAAARALTIPDPTTNAQFMLGTITSPAANQVLVYDGTKWVNGPPGSAAGPQGYQGYQGQIGCAGPQGIQGAGYQGVQGFQGPSGGPQGYQGNQGLTGAGTQGPQGYQGPIGAGGTGPQGIQGSQGISGFQGYQGFTGGVGPQGYQGFQGVQGSTGAGGPAGSTGPQGDSPDVLNFVLGSGTPATVGNDKTNHLYAVSNSTITKAFIVAKTGPVGSALIIDILQNGTSIWNTNTGNRLQIASGSTTGSQTSFDSTNVNSGDIFSINIIQVGSTTAGQDITVQLVLGISGTGGSQGTGSQGAQGSAGSIGPQGYQGFQGNSGSAGSTGPQGYQGSSGSGTAGGSNGQIQYNSSGAFAGSSNISTDGTNLLVTNYVEANTSGLPVVIGAYPGGAGSYCGLWATSSPTGTNYQFLADSGGNSYFNGTNQLFFRINNADYASITTSGLTVSSNISSRSATITSMSAANTTLIISAASGQFADLVQCRDNSGNIQTNIDSNGYAFTRTITFVLGSGTPCATGTNLTNQVMMERNGKIVKAYINATTAPTGSALIVNILKNGTSIWSANTGNRLQLAASATTGTQTSFDTTSVAEGDLFSINVDQVGSTVPGENVTVQLLCITRNN